MDTLGCRNMNKWVPQQNNPETSLEAKMTTQKLPYFGHIMRRQSSLEKTIVLGKQKAAGKEEETMKWVDST